MRLLPPLSRRRPTRRARRPGERGQTTVEFVGGFLVVCAILVAVYALVPDVRHHIHALVDRALLAMRDGPG